MIAEMKGGPSHDVMWGSGAYLSNYSETLYGDGGDDTIFANPGQDTVYGGYGNDRIHGGNGVDSLWGGNGALVHENDPDGDDIICDLGGYDSLYGQFGNDFLWVPLGATANLHGHLGYDECGNDDSDPGTQPWIASTCEVSVTSMTTECDFSY